MNQFFFGSSDRPLYGVHHEPTSSEHRRSAVLVCYPFGREYMRCHRAIVRLCGRLSASGYHCLRFDYFGTGDSAGESGEGNMDEWTANARSAAQELRDISGLDELSIVGVRLGAAIAVAIARGDPAIDMLALWDPVVSGSRHLEELESVHARFVVDSDRFPKRGRTAQDADTDELVGMICPIEMRRSIRNVDLNQTTAIKVKRASIIATEDRQDIRDFTETLGRQVADCSYELVDDRIAWDNLADLGSVLMPHDLLRVMHNVITDGE